MIKVAVISLKSIKFLGHIEFKVEFLKKSVFFYFSENLEAKTIFGCFSSRSYNKANLWAAL